MWCLMLQGIGPQLDTTRLRQLATQLGDLHEQEMQADKVSIQLMRMSGRAQSIAGK